MRVVVSDRESAENGVLMVTTYAVISIRDPGSRKAKIPRTSGLVDILYTDFHDAEPTANFVLPPTIQLMTPEQAQEIWNFVVKTRPYVGAYLVHCHQGMSRSPAVAAAIARCLNANEAKFFRDYNPNMYIWNLLYKSMPEMM